MDQIFSHGTQRQPLNNAPAFNRMLLNLLKLIFSEPAFFAQNMFRYGYLANIVKRGIGFNRANGFGRQLEIACQQAAVGRNTANVAAGFIIVNVVYGLHGFNNAAVDGAVFIHMPPHHQHHAENKDQQNQKPKTDYLPGVFT